MTALEIIALLTEKGVRLSVADGQLKVSAPKGALTEDLRALLVENKAEILALLSTTAVAADEGITQADRSQPLPLSFSQQRLWFLNEFEPDSALYNIPSAILLDGTLDISALQQAFDELIARHESLRTTFTEQDDAPVQTIAATLSVPVEIHQAVDPATLGKELTRLSQTPFDLTHGPLLRLHVIPTAENRQALLVVIHHIIADGWAMGVFMQELAALYDAAVTGNPAALPDLTAQLADYAAWQHEHMQGDKLQAELDYWNKALAGAPLVLELPTDRPRPASPDYSGDWLTHSISAGTRAGLERVAQEHGATLYMVLLAAFDVLLSRHSGSDELLVGSPVAGRSRSEFEQLIGSLINTVALRADLSANPQFDRFLETTRDTVLSAFEHQELPFEKLVEELQPDRNLSHSPVYQVLFNLQNRSQEVTDFSGLSAEALITETGTAKLDLHLLIEETTDGLNCWFEYATELFDRTTIERMAQHYEAILRAIAADCTQAVNAISILEDSERDLILNDWNNTARDYPADVTLVDLFEAQVARTPDAVAIGFGQQQVSYAELNGRANKLAHELISYGVDTGAVVGVFMERSVEMVVALYGIQKAGAAYVPLDPEYPPQRLANMLEDSGTGIVLTQAAINAELPGYTGSLITLDSDGLSGNDFPEEKPDRSPQADDLAYVIFTSGSTGRPKGVMNEHRGIVNRLLWMQDEYQLTANDTVLQKTAFSFDVSVWEFFWPLMTGARLVMARPGGHKDPGYLIDTINSFGVTTMHFVPSMLQAFLLEAVAGEPNCPSLRQVMCSGEALPWDTTQDFYARFNAELHNLYGPTEAAIDVTYWHCPKESPVRRVPIGRPVANTQIYIADKGGQLAPAGIPGELLIGGIQVARGYINREELTAERFISDPYTDKPGARAYRTGDLARFLPDGSVEYLGRMDAQIKLRGFRIELGEIDAALADLEAVEFSTTIVHTAVNGSEQLVSYIVSQLESVDTSSLRDQLASALPDYMVPAAIMQIDALPLTPNGKLDRKALPAPDWSDLDAYVAPRTQTEHLLADIWSEVLGIDKVGVNSDFFALGGHSLLATRLVTRIRASFNCRLSLKQVFEAPRIAALAKLLDTSTEDTSAPAAIQRVDRDADLPLTAAQRRLWFLHKLLGDSSLYNIPWAIRLQGPLDTDALQTALQAIVQRHESLRTGFREDQGQPVQFINDDAQLTLIRHSSNASDKTKLQNLLLELSQQAFELDAAPLIRAHLITGGDNEHVLLLVIHHIIADGWSLNVLFNDLSAAYSAGVNGESPALPELPVQYVDYAAWQETGAEQVAADIDYWRERLAGAPALLELPTDKARPAVQSYAGNVITTAVPAELREQLRALSSAHGTTLFNTLLTAFALLMSRYSQQDDILIGTPVSGRNRPEIEDLVGFFLNTLVIRTRLDNGKSFNDHLEQVSATTLEAFEHQALPFERLVEELQPARDMSHSPLFQVMFTLQNVPDSTPLAGGLTSSNIDFNYGNAKFDITFSLIESRDSLSLSCEYATDLFTEDTIRRLLSHYEELLGGISAAPDRPVAEIPMLTRSETRLLQNWNRSASDYPRQDTLHSLFEAQAAQTPEAVAVEFEGNRLSYAELNARANALAQELIELGAGPDKRVAICVSRQLDTLTGLLGILKSGAGYVPLDPIYPPERIGYMLEDSGAGILVSEPDLAAQLDTAAVSVVDIAAASRGVSENPQVAVGSDSLAYLIYTSGSTGLPKGVQIEHRAAINFLHSMAVQPGITAADRLLAVTTLCFDISILELFLPILNGATVVIAAQETSADGFALKSLLDTANISMMQATPATWRMLHQAGWSGAASLKVLVGGEALERELAEQLFSANESVWNMYGPTETTIWSACHSFKTSDTCVSVGRPIANTQFYVLDESLQLTPVGVPGELWIGGDGVARGYWQRDELNAEKFIDNPFGEGKIYCTGDRVRWLSDGSLEGTLEVLGRTDYQVKLRGFRIELGEIEARLNSIQGVTQAVVTLREDTPGDQRLVAYCIAPEGVTLAADLLRSELQDALPDYMVPSAFVQLERLPLTPNGKIDRKALPAPEWDDIATAEYVAPRTDTETTLCELFAATLGIESDDERQVGIHDDFFGLGGHSLLAVNLLTRVRDSFGSDIELINLFAGPTVAELAVLLDDATDSQTESIPRADRSAALPPSSAQTRLWFLDELEPGSAAYNMPWAMRLEGSINTDALRTALGQLVARHESLRTSFPAFDGEPSQRIHDSLEPVFETAALSADYTDAQLQEQLKAAASRPFDLQQGPLLRAHLFSASETEHVLLIVLHHIIYDAGSHGVLLNELATLYAAACSDSSATLAELPLQFADYAAWEQEWVGREECQAQLDYWKVALNDIPAALELPTDYPRPAVQSTAGARFFHSLPDDLLAKLQQLAAAKSGTLFMVLLAAYDVLLAKYANQQDIVVSTPVSGRNRSELEPVIGFFLNTLAIRAQLDEQLSFDALLDQLRKTTVDAFAHQDIPFEKLVEAIEPVRDTSRAPIAQVQFVLQHVDDVQTQFGDLRAGHVAVDTGTTKFDLTLFVSEVEGTLAIDFEYNTSLFRRDTIARMANHFENLLRTIVTAPETTLANLSMLGEAESRQVIQGFNRTDADFGTLPLVHQFVERQAERTPDSIAVQGSGHSLSYSELNARANRLAHALINCGATDGALVAISCERSVEMTVATLAVLKAGAGYIPVDPNYPADRVAYMLADSGSALLLTQSSLTASAPEGVDVIELDRFDFAQGNASNPDITISADSPVYAIYTSGSTGQPKGVVLSHAGLSNLIQWQQNATTLTEPARTLQFASLSFDVSFQELYTTWAQGGTLVMITEELRKDLPALAEFIGNESIERLYMPYAALQPLAELLTRADAPSALRDIVSAGEQLQITEAIRALFLQTGARLHNQYGPSETHVVTALTLPAKPAGWPALPTIGHPVSNTRCYILDTAMRPVPIGVPGELYLAGVQVAKEYLNRPELTAEKILPDAFHEDARMYRTGDRARYKPNGAIEYFGRVDDQVKFRGFRIEPGEIEAALTAHPAVQLAAVVLLGSGSDQKLVAYTTGDNPDTNTLREHAKERLPDYMVPTHFVVLDDMPLTPSGKVARRKLPEPLWERDAAQAYVAPRNDTETALATIWSDVLGIDTTDGNAAAVGVHDDFFELGGHSLLATKAVSRIRDTFGVALPLMTLFSKPTIAELAINLASELGDGVPTDGTAAVIPARGNVEPLPLSYAQQRLWFMDQLDPGNPAYNLPWPMRFAGEFNADAMQRALDLVVKRHESLRTRFPLVNGKPVQQIDTDLTVEIAAAGDVAEGDLAATIADCANNRFDLAEGPLLTARLYKVADNDHVLMLVIHHIISDLWSSNVMLRELSAAYNAFIKHEQPALTEPGIQYADYAVWQQDDEQAAAQARQLDYWKERLAAAPPLLELPTDRPRPPVQTFAGSSTDRLVRPELLEQLKQLSSQQGCTLFMTLLGAFQILLARYSNQTDIVVGSPIAGRNHSGLEDLVGIFINTLALRTEVAADAGFTDLMQQVKQNALEAYDHQDLPFERLVEELQPERNQSYTPLFQVLFSLQDTPPAADLFDGLSMSTVEFGYADVKYDITLVTADTDDGLQLRVDYNSDLFDAGTMQRFASHFEQLLEGITANPDRPVNELAILGDAERQQLLVEWNATDVAYPELAAKPTLQTLVEAQVVRTPDAAAIEYDGHIISYDEFNTRANQLAHVLMGRGVGPESLVGVLLERSAELVITLHAIEKAGGAYVPLDPDYPQQRLEQILEDAQLDVLVTEASLQDRIAFDNTLLVSDPEITAAATNNPEARASENSLAYVIFTSGSTGRPKGVMNEHRGIVNRLLWMQSEYQLDTSDRVLQKTPFSFDVSVWEFFWPLMTGARLVVAKPGGHKDPDYLAELIDTTGVTTLHFVPSMLQLFLQQADTARCNSIKRVICSGEALPLDLTQRFFSQLPSAGLHNLYGPTEAAIDVTYWACEPDSTAGFVPIGRPVANTSIYIVDETGNPVPVGVPGELWIGGIQVARGYINRPELTAERFIADPFSDSTDARIYRTGDLVRYRDDGRIEFLGRIDHQIKLRGFRIELGEIEAVLDSMKEVDQSVVVLHGKTADEQKLVAYVTGSDVEDTVPLRDALAEQLPEYMVPAVIMPLDTLPLTASGKVDRKQLPEPVIERSSESYVAPRTPTEEILCEIWSDVLQTSGSREPVKIGIHDDFFSLGGHSLLAAQAVARVRDTLNIALQLRDLFDSPTVAGIAKRLDQLGGKAGEPPVPLADRSRPLPLSFPQQRLWFLEQLEPGNPVYNLPWAVTLNGPLDKAALQTAINGLTQRHETLRTCFASRDGVSVQVIEDSIEVALLEQDATGSTGSELRNIVSELGQQPFDLTTAPLFRCHLLRTGDDEHLFVMNMHHIISDGWSLHVLFRELITLYEAAHRQQAANLPTLPLQYADYAAWQRSWLETDGLINQLDYWRGKLKAAATLLELPADRPRGAVQTFEGRHLSGALSPELTARLRQLAADNGSTLFMVALAAFNVVLARYSNQEDILIGTPVAGRKRTELESLVGFFVNTLVLRTDMTANPAFTDLLQQVKQTALDAFDNQELPFEKLVDEVQPTRDMSHSPLFQVMFVMQNQPWTGEHFEELEATNFEMDYGTAKFDLTVSLQESGDGLSTYFEYNTALFDEVTIRQLRSHFSQLLEAVVAAPETPVAQLPLMYEVELDVQFTEWNPPKSRYRDAATIHELIAERAAETPDAIAVSFGDERVSYADLNGRANQIAHHLIARGVGNEQLVGICLERSVDMVAAILAVFKSGGAYVPLDPEYPSDRIAYMLDDSQAKVIITTNDLSERLPAHNAQLLELDTAAGELSRESRGNPEERSKAENLAYVIYTSGSTGNPKGVMLQHQGACNLMRAQARVFGLNNSDRMLQFASISFDASIFELVMGLGVGAEMVLGTKDELAPGTPLLTLLQNRRVTAVTLPPSALMQLPDAELPDLRVITVAGEACPQELVDRWSNDECRFFNLYGPTETTVWATYEECAPGRTPTIGGAVPNAEVYILNEHDQPVPVGVAGELCLGGAGLARGYLNRPELTAEKFIEHPCLPGTRIYRTGDLVRFNRDGQLEFLGRIDHQVKVRGFRIELGEIETTLAEHPGVRECVVLARGENLSDRQLVAYLVAEGKQPTLNDLRNHLQQSLPDFMVPASFVVLDEFPLTPNGKVDRKALPGLDSGKLQIDTEFVTPRNRNEEILAGIWATLLGVERVGIYDNFFELGGDSILSIQIIARAAQEGVTLAPRQLFQHQTIAELAAAIEIDTPVIAADQGRVLGTPSLTPIQEWFFSRNFAQPEHFNQSLLFETTQPLNAVILEQALHLVTDHHDALRMRYAQSADGWQQSIAPFEDAQLVTEINSGKTDQVLDRVQTRLNIGKGPLLKAALINPSAGQAQRLLLTVHHLAVDWVSWPVLITDLETAYNRLGAGKPVAFPRKTTAFKAWSEKIADYATSEALQDELGYWQALPWSDVAALPADHADGDNIVGHSKTLSVSLNESETRQLFREVASRFRVQANDLLLTAVGRALKQWSGSNNVLIELEGHGREDIFDDADVSRTVGWFTTLYPVLLQLGDEDPAAALGSVRQQLQKVPGKGLGYGALRYLNPASGLADLVPTGQIGFNYLGQVDKIGQTDAADSLFKPCNDYRGLEHAPQNERTHLVDINSLISEDCLHINIGFSSQVFEDSTVERFSAAIEAELQALITTLDSTATAQLQPADFPLATLDQAAIDTLTAARADIEDIYPLTPLQQGMLFHSLLDSHTDVYFASFNWDLEGVIDVDKFVEAWNLTINLHSSLRTAIHWNNLKDPLQVVYPSVDVPVTLEDWRELNEAERGTRLNALVDNDRSRAFDLNKAPLTRVTLVRLEDTRWHMIWSFHHMVMDGWSVPLVIRQMFNVYESLAAGNAPELIKTRPFSDYIGWLQTQDGDAAEHFWKTNLQGFIAPTPLPGANVIDAAQAPLADYQEAVVQLPADFGATLKDFAQQHRLTINSVTQGAWALLLSRYSGEEDVVFGATTAGRPATLSGIESMIGLFLNTLPVRVAIDEQQSLIDWLRGIQDQQLNIQQYEYASLVDVQGWSDVPRGKPLFETLLAFENYPDIQTMGSGSDAGSIEIKSSQGYDRTNFPLTLNVAMMDTLYLRFIYDRNLFSEATMTKLAEHLQLLLQNIPSQPDAKIADIPMLTTLEQQQLDNWNNTARDYEGANTLPSLLYRQAELTPDAPALRYDSETLSYAELDARSNQLAHFLVDQGVGAESLVGVCMERSVELVVTLHAIVKAGGAYVPMDPEYPAQRLEHMAEDAQLSLLLSQQHLGDILPGMARINIEDIAAEVSSLPAGKPHVNVEPTQAAYVIFTSGSTGRPKGVLNEHHGIANRLLWMQDEYGLDASDRVLQKTPFSFDVSVWEFFWPFIAGAELVVAKPGGHRDSGYLAALIKEHAVTTLHFVPSMLQVFVQDAASAGCTTLKRVICSGEALPYELQTRFFAQYETAGLHNLYGPTEAAIDVTYWACRRDSTERVVPIGHPVANTRLYVVDQAGHRTPPGVPGELWISGIQVARGYVNRPELTAERFINDPFADGFRVYRTGDLVRYREDGALEFLGRIDNQVKLRGFRIELGEIEAVVAELPGIEQAIVMLREDTPGLQQLVGYVVMRDGAELDSDAVVAGISGLLPDYMVPGVWLAIDEVPLSPNGKIERRALPAPDVEVQQVEYIAPRDEFEETLAGIWSELLGVEQVGIRDDFFSLGGHSLVAMRAVTRLRDALNIDIPLDAMFAAPTIAELAETVNKSRDNTPETPTIKRVDRSARRTKRRRPKTDPDKE